MTNQDLRFRIDFRLDSSPKDLTFTDLIGNPAGADYNTLLAAAPNGESSADILGIAQFSSPAGVFYSNNYNTSSFAAPDIDGSTNTWSKTAVPLPLSGGEVICGNYNFQYKVRLNLLGVFGGFAAGSFQITGDYTALFPSFAGLKLQVYGGSHSGTYDITGISYSAPNTLITVSGAVVPFAPDPGETIGIVFETSRSFVFCYDRPESDIDISSSCVYSQVTFTDNSNYDAQFSGINVLPTVSRAWSVSVPVGMSGVPATGVSNPFVIGYGTSIFGGANIWTGNYTANLTSSLVYILSNPAFLWGTYTWVRVYDEFTSTEGHTVECETCFCDIIPCINNLITKYTEYLGTNPTKAQQLLSKVVLVLSNWMQYQQAERCGEDIAPYCAAITQIVLSENCQCNTGSVISEEVIPLALQVVGGAGCCGVTFGIGVDGFPASPTVGDIHFFTLDGGGYFVGDVYGYTLGGWVFQYNTQGIQGIQGIPGVNGTNGTNGTTIIFDNTLATPTVITNAGYIPFAGMSYNVVDLTDKGDKVEINGVFSALALNELNRVKIQIGGSDIPMFLFFGVVPLETKFTGTIYNVFWDIEMTLINPNTDLVGIRAKVRGYDIVNNYMGGNEFFTTYSVPNYTIIPIQALGRTNGVDSVTCSQLTVKLYKNV